MTKLLENLKIPYFFMEVLRIVVGLNFILLANHFFEVNLEFAHNINQASDFIKLLFLLSFSYLLGFIFAVIATTWMQLVRFTFLKDKKERVSSNFEDFRRIANRENGQFDNNSKTMNYEIEEYIAKNKIIRDLFIRTRYGRCLSKMILGASIVLLFLLIGTFSNQLVSIILIASLIVGLTIQDIQGTIANSRFRSKVAEHVAKEKLKSKER